MVGQEPWKAAQSRTEFSGKRFAAIVDDVTRPDGQADTYEWIHAPDQIRVAAMVEGSILLTKQSHYLIGEALQLPGGAVEPGESPEAAARRELQEETGLHGGEWTSYGLVHPIPSLTDMSIHLWAASGLAYGDARPEPSEVDLRIVRLGTLEARQAALDGRLTCAGSCALVLRLTC